MRHGILLVLLTTLLAALPGVPAARADVPATPPSKRTTAGYSEGEDDSYTLSAAYPNPFRSQTRFDLRVKERQRVEVAVYNLLGQRVRTLYEGTIQSGQERTFTFKAGSLPSGLYLYRIEGETFTAARRVTLVK